MKPFNFLLGWHKYATLTADLHICARFMFFKITCLRQFGGEVRKIKKMSQDELAKKLDVHGAVIGRYERDEVKPSIELAAAVAEALEVSLDYLVGNTDLLLEKNVLNKIIDIQKLGTEDKAHVFALLDAFLQSHKAKKVFAS